MSSSLEFRQTTIGYGRRGRATSKSVTPVVSEASFTVHQGRTVALVGQSGSGKSTLAAAAVGLLARNGSVLSGDILLGGESVGGFREKDWRAVRGNRVGYIPQDPLSSLDPVQRIGSRLVEHIRLHRQVTVAEATAEAIQILDRVGIADPEAALVRYPHQLSGGQLQRVLIGLAISAQPELLIADEPTSALDVTVQRTILDLLDELSDQLDLSVLLITHDLALAADHADDLAVINQGKIVESGPVDQVLHDPRDPYTAQLFQDVPALSPDRYARTTVPASPESLAERTPALRVDSAWKVYPGATTPALKGVSLTVQPGTVHAVVGESGSGKTTLGRILAGIEGYDDGAVQVQSATLPPHPPVTNPRAQLLQLVHQNPLAALNPRWRVEQLVGEPLVVHHGGSAEQRRHTVIQTLEAVGLSPQLARRRPAELSGGQRQRVAIARALITEPEVVIFDEPTSALDVTVQRQVVDVLMGLQRSRNLTFVFISHDLSLVRQIADEVTVLRRGEVVEHGSVSTLFNHPSHPYTQALVNAVPGRQIGATASPRAAEDLVPIG